MTDAPTESNADEWALFLSDWGTAYCAVRIAEAIEAAEQRGYARGVEEAADYCDTHTMDVPMKASERVLAGMFVAGEPTGTGSKHHGNGYAAALRALSPTPPAPGTQKVKPLVWGCHPAGQLASNNMGGSYIIDTRGPYPKWLKWPGGHGPDRETVEEMQAAAQADHEARVLSQTDIAPMTLQEAARVLADMVEKREWPCYPIEMPLTYEGKGPATLGVDATDMSYEVWDAVSLRALSEHEKLPDAIASWLRALAEQEWPSNPPRDGVE
jgi:hypothetical protein